MLSKQEIKNWLLENAVDYRGDLDLSDLDFSDFDGDVLIYNMKVKKSLQQSFQDVGENLYQEFQKVDKSLHQYYQKVGESLHQYGQKVGGDFYNHKLNEDEYWEEKRDCVVRIKKLQKITKQQLAEMGYELTEEK